ncbi:hypothetical protein J42TS3_14940 [Paenibacillus vini]|uniref:Uncharacterized protein n=1 Tax=Paenibacillus vini TaxID=1476024 RepID=A0ABQ4M8Z6_9BACL|nr:hypothetical protein J42TS3_14940 [Paenibacillus vini]
MVITPPVDTGALATAVKTGLITGIMDSPPNQQDIETILDSLTVNDQFFSMKRRFFLLEVKCS